jgi:hypothetical protein
MECVDWQIVLFFKDGARASRGGEGVNGCFSHGAMSPW